MKIIIMAFIFSSLNLYAKKSPEKVLTIKTRIVKMMLEKEIYKIELEDYAAVYYANEKILPCLQKSMKENKTATLEVTAYSLNIQKCNVE
ncbi:MAG: hypothetical protein K2Q18_05915 [Bdellovibrionales bacterium]|nr:hypothetical protein [Bdellovibrionales bacterium]